MNLMPMAQKLEDDGFGVMGTSIFINMIPIECPEGILLRNKLSGTAVDYELPGYYKTTFQLIVRTQDYAAGDALIEGVIDALTLSNKALGTMSFIYMRPITMPVVFPLSKGNLLEFAADFAVAFTQ